MKDTDTVQKLRFDDIHNGDTASFDRVIIEEDVTAFAFLSGDRNPIHVDETYAATTPLRTRVVHGMFLGALVSRLIGMELPGQHALLVKEALEFHHPVHIGDTVRVAGVVEHISQSTHLLTIGITITVGTLAVATGSVHVKVRV